MDPKLLRGTFPSPGSAAGKIAEAISRGHRTYTAIRGATGIPASTLTRHLTALVAAEVLARDGLEYVSCYPDPGATRFPDPSPSRNVESHGTQRPKWASPGPGSGPGFIEFSGPGPGNPGVASGLGKLGVESPFENTKVGVESPSINAHFPQTGTVPIHPFGYGNSEIEQIAADLTSLVPQFDPSPYEDTPGFVAAHAAHLDRWHSMLTFLADPTNEGQIRNASGWIRWNLKKAPPAPRLPIQSVKAVDLPPAPTPIGRPSRWEDVPTTILGNVEGWTLSTALLDLEREVKSELRVLGIFIPHDFRTAGLLVRRLAMSLRSAGATALDLGPFVDRALAETEYPNRQVPIEALVRYVRTHGRPATPLLLTDYGRQPGTSR